MPTFTILDDGAPTEVDASLDGESVRIAPAALDRALGWQLKPEGLCQGNVCYPIPPNSTIVTPAGVDLELFAGLLGRPVALDVTETAAFFGVSASARSAQLLSLEAPDFTLPDLEGRLHSLAEHRGKKVLLAAYASW